MHEWGGRFTCIAPDTPGFGQSDPLTGDTDAGAFADAIVEFLDAAGIARCLAYGFHSGGIFLVAALRRHPERFVAVGVGGYAVWRDEEREALGAAYLPPFVPSAYGEHLTWLWNRVLEQSWFFPWCDVRDATRLSIAHADPVRANGAVRDLLEAGDAHRAGYGAALTAPCDIPPADATVPPALITAYAGDPLAAHIERLPPLPPNWTAHPVSDPGVHLAETFAFLGEHDDGTLCPEIVEVGDVGFVAVSTANFAGLMYWHGDQVDPPGHGLSDGWRGDAPEDWAPWQAVFDAFGATTGRPVMLPPLHKGDPDALYPDLSPDRFGAYLTRAWSIARASALFDPWYEANAAHAIPVDQARLAPEALAVVTRDILRSPAAKALHLARFERGEC